MPSPYRNLRVYGEIANAGSIGLEDTFNGTLLGQQKYMVQKISRAIMPAKTKGTLCSVPRLGCRRSEQNLHLFCES